MRLNENVLLQFCLAHFIRDVKFLAEHPERKNRTYGKRLVENLRELFGIIHRRDEYSSEEKFVAALENARNDLVWNATIKSPGTREALALEARFHMHTESYFRFITEANVEPTNNLAEQAIRFVAIHRRITQGTRSEDGRHWCERIWTIIQTCGQQNRSIYEFLCAAVEAAFQSSPAPTYNIRERLHESTQQARASKWPAVSGLARPQHSGYVKRKVHMDVNGASPHVWRPPGGNGARWSGIGEK